MRKLILKMSVSVDGFVAGPRGEMDWMFRTMSGEGAAWVLETLKEAGLHIMGSRTYHDMAAYWPTSTEPMAEPMNTIPKLIFSKKGLKPTSDEQTTMALKDARRLKGHLPKATSPAADWSNVPVSSDLVGEITRLKKENGKNILAHGGASFARSLVKEGLVDEYRLVTHPVVLGRGLSVFNDLPQPFHFQLVSATSFKSGVVAHVYRPA